MDPGVQPCHALQIRGRSRQSFHLNHSKHRFQSTSCLLDYHTPHFAETPLEPRRPRSSRARTSAHPTDACYSAEPVRHPYPSCATAARTTSSPHITPLPPPWPSPSPSSSADVPAAALDTVPRPRRRHNDSWTRRLCSNLTRLRPRTRRTRGVGAHIMHPIIGQARMRHHASSHTRTLHRPSPGLRWSHDALRGRSPP